MKSDSDDESQKIDLEEEEQMRMEQDLKKISEKRDQIFEQISRL